MRLISPSFWDGIFPFAVIFLETIDVDVSKVATPCACAVFGVVVSKILGLRLRASSAIHMPPPDLVSLDGISRIIQPNSRRRRSERKQEWEYTFSPFIRTAVWMSDCLSHPEKWPNNDRANLDVTSAKEGDHGMTRLVRQQSLLRKQCSKQREGQSLEGLFARAFTIIERAELSPFPQKLS